MVESIIARVILDLSIVLLILGSIVELVVDLRGMETSEFLPEPLSEYPPSHPAMALATAGVVGLLLGTLLELNPLPGGRIVVGTIGIVAFLFAGGFVLEDE